MNPSLPDPVNPPTPPTESLESPDDGAKNSVPPTEAAPQKRDVPDLFVPVVLPESLNEAKEQEAASVAVSAVPTAVEPTAVEPTATILDREAKNGSIENHPLEETGPDPLEVEFSSSPDTAYQASLTLELRCATPEASIHFGLGVEQIDENSDLYDQAQKILLTQSAKVSARAFAQGRGGPLVQGYFEIVKPGWQKLEPADPSDPTRHEESDQATLEGPWRLAAASVRGKLHAHRAGWREDAFRHDVAHAVDGTFSIVVVSDGAGSAPLSRVASNLACQTALDVLSTALRDSQPLASEADDLICRDLPLLRGHLVAAAQLALEKVREEATARNRPLSEFSATLLILVRREWSGQQLCAALQCGDGGIALWNEDETLTLLGEADHGQQSGETRFLTSNGMESEFPARVKFSIRPNLRAVAVMSDGVADDYFPEAGRFPELFRSILPLMEGSDLTARDSESALLNWIRYEKKGSSDDRTLVVCWRAGLPAQASGEDGNAQL